MEYTIAIPTAEETDYIDDMLMEHNRAAKPFEQEEPFIGINRCIKNEQGEVIGGLLAYSVMWRILYIDMLWVQADQRGKGIGSMLLKAVEKEAKATGCHVAHLDTFDFQGKDFYVKNGYTVFGTIEDCPLGHSEHFLFKRL